MHVSICITPFRELRCGTESIHDYVQEGYSVPAEVIRYLQTTNPYVMSPGKYEHPFIPGRQLLGPYLYTDGKYCWDRDTWKYVVKYHVRLPDEFIAHVLSDEGKAFLEQFGQSPSSWSDTITEWKEQENMLCLLPKNAGDVELAEF